ncbi:ABC transporter permease [Amycolatopsis jejuensis]|uniref:ABC transporter permease n=1 Tax=Amycolatopsis jejuensis TaxID=330084 RepID=UPI000AFA247A|nr:ABC transporter permease [Amycolatopsis jejuensis]
MNELPSAAAAQAVADPPPPAPEANPPETRRRIAFGMDRFSGLYVLALIVLVFGLWIPDTFLSVQTLNGIALQQAITAMVGLGLIAPYAAGVFDLSVGSMLGLSVVVVCKLQASGVDWALAVVLTLLMGTLVGAVNGAVIVGLRVDSFIGTLAMSAVLGALVYWVSGNQQITTGISEHFIQLGQGKLLGIPLPVVYLAAVALLIGFVTEFRPLGRKLYATGGNPLAARLSGVKTDRLVISSLMLSGTIAALAGIIFAAIIGSASLTAGPPFLLPAFAAVFLGATQIHPGRANVLGTLVAVFVLGTGVKGLLLVGAQFWVSDLFNGLTLLVAVALAVRRGRPRGRPGRKDSE